MGIEPTFVAWEATVLPLNYTRDPAKVYGETVAGSKSRTAVCMTVDTVVLGSGAPAEPHA
jgi:hypothetical protein